MSAKVQFLTVRVLKAQNLLQNVTVDYELGPEMYPTEVKKGVLLKNGELKLQGRNGFGVPGMFFSVFTESIQTVVGE